MGAGDFLAEGVGGKFNVTQAKGAGHFQVFGRAQGEGFLAKRAGDFAARILAWELDFSAARGAEHFELSRWFGHDHRRFLREQQERDTASQHVQSGTGYNEVGRKGGNVPCARQATNEDPRVRPAHVPQTGTIDDNIHRQPGNKSQAEISFIGKQAEA